MSAADMLFQFVSRRPYVFRTLPVTGPQTTCSYPFGPTVLSRYDNRPLRNLATLLEFIAIAGIQIPQLSGAISSPRSASSVRFLTAAVSLPLRTLSSFRRCSSNLNQILSLIISQ
jgi:hypothetical protein